MSKKVITNKQKQKVNEAVETVVKKNMKLLVEMRVPNKNVSYSENPKPMTHKPIVLDRVFVPGEFVVPFENSHHIYEGKEENYPLTLDSKYTIAAIRNRYKLAGNEITFTIIDKPHKPNDSIAMYILLNMDEDEYFKVDERPLQLLDELFHACGYFRSTPDLVLRKNETDPGCVRQLQYEPYHYTEHPLKISNQLYHITTPDNKDAIKEHGFIASCKTKVPDIQYPPRNYFFVKLNERIMSDYMYDAEKIGHHEDRCHRIPKYPVTIIYINTNKLKNNIIFYSDPKFMKSGSVYTYDDIGPEHVDNMFDTEF